MAFKYVFLLCCCLLATSVAAVYDYSNRNANNNNSGNVNGNGNGNNNNNNIHANANGNINNGGNANLNGNSNANGNTLNNIASSINNAATLHEPSNIPNNNIDALPHSYNNAATAVGYSDNSQATPPGYDYRPQQQQQQQLQQSPQYNAVENSARQFDGFAAQPQYNPQSAKYDYNYNVHDDYTGDIKSHAEARDGYYVRGAYSVVDPDGFKRTVTYTVDDTSGFNAIVNREPYALKAAVPAVAPAKAATAATTAPVVAVTPAADANAGSAASDSQLVELPLSGAQAAPVEQASRGSDKTQIDLPAQPRDSYASVPSVSHNGEGPYP